jgi:DNA-binding XRE family transcriptional regulator
MATTITLPEVAVLLREKRNGAAKTEAARSIGVSRQIYGAWEDGFYTPGDEWAEKLAAYLGVPLKNLVWTLYQDRMNRAKGVYRSSILAAA